MNNTSPLPFPLSLLVLDGVGALLVALGAAGHFGNVTLLAQLLPTVPNVNLLAMLIGAVIMAVAMVGIVRATLVRARALRDGTITADGRLTGKVPRTGGAVRR